MKKIISFILCLAMICSVSVSAFAVELTDIKDSTYADSIQTLVDLGVIEGFGDGTFRPETMVTRAQMATIIIKTLGLSDLAKPSITNFTDVPQTHWASGTIALANSLGIIYGYGNNKFGPEDNVTYDQAITMVIRALGYDISVLQGQWPAAYVMKAAGLGILDGFYTGSAPAKRGEIAKLMTNTLNEKMVMVHGDKLTILDDTFMKRLKANVSKELVTYTADTKINLINSIGQFATVYRDNKQDIISVIPTNDILTGEFKDTNKFIVGDKEYTVRSTAINASTAAFTNCEQVGTATLVNKHFYTLDCNVNGNYITKINSVSEWVGGQTFQVDATDIRILNDRNELGNFKFELDTNDNIEPTLVVFNGVSSAKDITKDDIVTVYTYGNRSSAAIVRVDVATKTIAGKVVKIQDDKYTINNTVYELADSLSKLEIGVEYKCYIDATGKIFKADRISNSNYKFAIYYGAEAGSAFKDAKIGVYTPTNTKNVTVLPLDEDMVIASLPAIHTLIKYTVDKNGFVDGVVCGTTAAAARLSNNVLIADGKYYMVDDNATVFTKDNTDKFNTSIISKIEKKTDLGEISYFVDSDNVVIAIMVAADKAEATTEKSYMVVNEISTVATADGSAKAVSGFINGVTINDAVTMSTHTTDTISLGSIVLYRVDYSGAEIKAFVEIPSSETMSKVEKKTTNGLIYGDNRWLAISDDAVIYQFKDGKFSISNQIPYDAHVVLYDIDTTADEVFDIVIWNK